MAITKRDEEKIRSSFQQKTWNDIKTHDSWSVFKIMSEFVEGMDRLSNIGPCVAIFGSARTQPDDPYYKLATEIAEEMTKLGFGIITGGGPGIMEAANRGAHECNAASVGLNIRLPFEKHGNIYIDKEIDFDYFFVRKTLFMRYAQGYVVMPGGLGTMDELFEALTLIQTDKMVDFPVVLVGKEYWSGLIQWMREVLLTRQMIKEEDFDIFHLVDTKEEVVAVIKDFYERFDVKPNF